MARKRILFIESNRDGSVGGSHMSLLNLVQQLDRDRYEPVVMFYERNALVPRFEKVSRVVIYDLITKTYRPITSFGQAARYLPKFFRYVFFAQIKLLRILKDLDPDLVHLNNGYFCCHEWMLASRLRGIRVIAHDRGGQSPQSAQTRIFSRLLDAIISVSDHFLDNVRKEGLRPRMACRIYDGLDPSLYDPHRPPEEIAAARRALGAGEDEVLVGMAGNLTWWKGQHIFVKAMHELLKRGRAVRGIIIGETVSEDYEVEIHRYISENGLESKISLLGSGKTSPPFFTPSI